MTFSKYKCDHITTCPPQDKTKPLLRFPIIPNIKPKFLNITQWAFLFCLYLFPDFFHFLALTGRSLESFLPLCLYLAYSSSNFDLFLKCFFLREVSLNSRLGQSHSLHTVPPLGPAGTVVRSAPTRIPSATPTRLSYLRWQMPCLSFLNIVSPTSCMYPT